MGLLWTERDLSDGPLRKKLQHDIKMKLPFMDYRAFNLSESDIRSLAKSSSGVDLINAMVTLGELSEDASKLWDWKLKTHKARVCIDLNVSESMRDNIGNGNVSTALATGLAWARLFGNDDMDVVTFDTCSRTLPKFDLSNMQKYVSQYIAKGCSISSAEYVLAIVDNIQEYFVNRSVDRPVLCFVITDGYSMNLGAVKRALLESARYKIFYQFVCLGGAAFPERFISRVKSFQEEHPDIPCNIGFVGFESLPDMNRYEVFRAILDQYHKWLKSIGCF